MGPTHPLIQGCPPLEGGARGAFLTSDILNEFPNILYSLEHSQSPSGLVIDKESEVYKMLQEKQELNEPPKQSTSFLVLQEILESEEKGNQLCGWPAALVQGPGRGPVIQSLCKQR